MIAQLGETGATDVISNRDMSDLEALRQEACARSAAITGWVRGAVELSAGRQWCGFKGDTVGIRYLSIARELDAMTMEHFLNKLGFAPEMFGPIVDRHEERVMGARRFGSPNTARYGRDPRYNDPFLANMAQQSGPFGVGGVEVTAILKKDQVTLEVIDPTVQYRQARV